MKKSSLIALFLIFALLLSACGTAASVEPEQTETVPGEQVPEETGEYTVTGAEYASSGADTGLNRVFYEIFVGSFSDSDGDGTGDIQGIINRLDYLNDGDPDSGKSLGVEGLWLTPVYKSISYHKYDVNDYYTIDPDFGTLEDLEELIRLCHERGMLIILDLPINHTGPVNQWFLNFKNARKNGDTEDPYYDFYSCYDASVESCPAGRSFSQIAGTDIYYECNFSGDMPELNYDNPAVRQAVLEVAKFYLDLGVDGFRFDAVKYIYYGDNARSAEFWTWFMSELREIKPDIFTVGECWDSDGITDKYYPALDCFNFTVSQAEGLIAQTANHGDVNRYTAYVSSYLDNISSLRDGAVFMPFVSNHDMDRAAGYLTVASGAMQMAANLYILSPGAPFIYYGEELGIRGSRGGASTDANRRLKMLWGDGDTVKDPSGSTYSSSNQIDTTAADQIKSSGSLYTYYKKLIMLRKANPEIVLGEYTALKLKDTKLGGFISEYGGNRVMVLHNTTIHTVTVDLSEITGSEFTVLAGTAGLEEASLSGSVLTLGGMTSVILR